MRSALRWLVLLIPTTLLLLALTHLAAPQAHTKIYEHLPNVKLPPVFGHGDPKKLPDIDEGLPYMAPVPTSPSTPSTPSPPPSTDPVHKLWNQWSEIIHNARPRTLPITISGQASTERPPHLMTVREPYRDLVKNPGYEIDSLQEWHRVFRQELDNFIETPGIFLSLIHI